MQVQHSTVRSRKLQHGGPRQGNRQQTARFRFNCSFGLSSLQIPAPPPPSHGSGAKMSLGQPTGDIRLQTKPVGHLEVSAGIRNQRCVCSRSGRELCYGRHALERVFSCTKVTVFVQVMSKGYHIIQFAEKIFTFVSFVRLPNGRQSLSQQL